MAQVALADVIAAMTQAYQSQITDQINGNSVGLNLIPTVSGRGQNCAFTAELSGRTNAESYPEGADMEDADFDSELQEPATLPWGKYRKGIKQTGLMQAAAASNIQPGTLLLPGAVDMFGSDFMGALRRLALGVGGHLYDGTGGGTDNIIGLDTAINDTGVYATIDQGVHAEWASTVDTLPLASVSLSNVKKKLLTPIYKASGTKPDLMLADPDLHDDLADLFGDRRRDVHTLKLSDGQGGRRTIDLEDGHEMIWINGVPVAKDVLATPNTLYAVNTRHVRFKQLPAYQSRMTGREVKAIIEGLIGQRLPDRILGEFQAAPGSLIPSFDNLAKTGDSDKAMVKVYAQLVVDRRNACGRLLFT